MTIQLAFYKGSGGIEDALIRFWTKGPYSHVELVLEYKGTHMTCLSSSGRDGGVRQKRIAIKANHWNFVPVPWGDKDSIQSYFMAKKSASYDWKGIFLSQIIPTARHDKGKYFCSEFCAGALGLSQPHRYSPNSLYAITKDIGKLRRSK